MPIFYTSNYKILNFICLFFAHDTFNMTIITGQSHAFYNPTKECQFYDSHVHLFGNVCMCFLAQILIQNMCNWR
jgi:hypothetical protein